ncbi:MAG: hypothetical protein U5L72_15270 [Bacteroidales bacterium]|nr:hypothetical protein [Bacteroidales bacterium]
MAYIRIEFEKRLLNFDSPDDVILREFKLKGGSLNDFGVIA